MFKAEWLHMCKINVEKTKKRNLRHTESSGSLLCLCRVLVSQGMEFNSINFAVQHIHCCRLHYQSHVGPRQSTVYHL